MKLLPLTDLDVQDEVCLLACVKLLFYKFNEINVNQFWNTYHCCFTNSNVEPFFIM